MRDYRSDLERIFMSAVSYADPEHLVRSRVLVEDGSLIVDSEHAFTPEKVFLFAFGKAACGMAKGFLSVCDVDRGVVVSNKVEKFPENITVIKGGHPLPDEGSLKGSEAMLKLAGEADKDTLCVFLVSGGGSAILSAPAYGISPEDKKITFNLLIKSGACVEDVNTVRRHISAVKGGRLAEAALPAQCVTLALSDVLSGAPEAIASGPTYCDHTTWKDVAEVVARYGLLNKIPPKVMEVIEMGEAGELPETVKRNRSEYKYNTLGSNLGGIKTAGDMAHMMGYKVRIYGQLDCDVTEAADIMAGRVAENLMHATGDPVCMIFGGEVTVNVTGDGKGGRCQQLALEFLITEKPVGIYSLSASTDGMDGDTDAAGAFTDDYIDPEGAEESALNNDAYNFFNREDSLLKTGLTGTNINDLYIIIIPKLETEAVLQALAEDSSYN